MADEKKADDSAKTDTSPAPSVKTPEGASDSGTSKTPGPGSMKACRAKLGKIVADLQEAHDSLTSGSQYAGPLRGKLSGVLNALTPEILPGASADGDND